MRIKQLTVTVFVYRHDALQRRHNIDQGIYHMFFVPPHRQCQNFLEMVFPLQRILHPRTLFYSAIRGSFCVSTVSGVMGHNGKSERFKMHRPERIHHFLQHHLFGQRSNASNYPHSYYMGDANLAEEEDSYYSPLQHGV
jgi:hypothetical protein